MGDASGAGTVVRDISGHGYDSTWTNPSSRVDKASVRAGGGRAVDLAGAAYFLWATAAQQSVSSFSREVWTRSDTSATMYLLSQYGASNGEDFWHLNSTDTYWLFGFMGGGFQYNTGDGGAGGVPTRRQNTHDNRPHHWVCTRQDNGQARIWVDGDLHVDIASGTSPLIPQAGGVGRRPVELVNNWTGVMQDAAIYDYALSRDQILRHYHAGRGLARRR